jgi:hypothetical protein
MANGKQDIFMIEGTYSHEAHLLSNTRGSVKWLHAGNAKFPPVEGVAGLPQ